MVSLKEARDLLIDAKRDLKAGINPALKKKCLKETGPSEAFDSFEAVAREWFEVKKTGKKESYTSRIWGRVEKELFPFFAKRPVGEISFPELLEVLRKVESRGTVETVHRCLQYGGQIFRYTIATGRMAHDISLGLKGALKPAIYGHMASLTDPKDVGGLLRVIDACNGNLIVRAALRMAPYVFVRPGELRHAEWSEIDLERAEWRIPADKMKMRRNFFVAGIEIFLG
jgi:integrase